MTNYETDLLAAMRYANSVGLSVTSEAGGVAVENYMDEHHTYILKIGAGWDDATHLRRKMIKGYK